MNYFEQHNTDVQQMLRYSGIFQLHEPVQLNEVPSKDKFHALLMAFFTHRTHNLLLIYVNPFVDSQRRLDLTISLINQCRA